LDLPEPAEMFPELAVPLGASIRNKAIN
jgi:hypothetical protein